jgi:hypothetical protein
MLIIKNERMNPHYLSYTVIFCLALFFAGSEQVFANFQEEFLDTDGTKAPAVFGVVVGIADYDGWLNDLEYADSDAIEFHRHFKLAMPSEVARGDLRLLTNGSATYHSIKSAIYEVFAKAGPDDFLVFYFSGHGNDGFFCPHDLFGAQLRHSEIKELFRRTEGRYRLIIADACYSGSIANSSPPATVSHAELMDSRIAVIMSSRTDQTSLEVSSLQNGLFTHALINGLQGHADENADKYITAGELFHYTKQCVMNATDNEQIPVIYGLNLFSIPLAHLRN